MTDDITRACTGPLATILNDGSRQWFHAVVVSHSGTYTWSVVYIRTGVLYSRCQRLNVYTRDTVSSIHYILENYYFESFYLTVASALSLGEAQVRLELADVAKLLLRIGGGNRRRDDDIVTSLPVNRGHNALLITRLQRVDHTQDLSRVTAGRGRVHHGQTDLLARVDDEDRPDGEGNALLGNVVQIPLVNHVVEEGHLAFSIGDDGELEVGAGDLVDVLDPFTVGAEVVGTLDSISSQPTEQYNRA